MMKKYIVKCIKHKAQNRRWVLQAGKIYEAQKDTESEIDITNHYGESITLTLKEFNEYCTVIKVI
jgi:hypothetical protein